MKILYITIIFIISLLYLSSCSKTPQQQILGKWKQDNDIIEFKNNQTFTFTQSGEIIMGEWKFSDSLLKLTYSKKDYPDFPITDSREFYFSDNKFFYRPKGSKDAYNFMQRTK